MLLLQVLFTKSTSETFDKSSNIKAISFLYCSYYTDAGSIVALFYTDCLRTHLLTVFECEGPAASVPPDFGVTIYSKALDNILNK